jgi:hypothetical protein
MRQVANCFATTSTMLNLSSSTVLRYRSDLFNIKIIEINHRNKSNNVYEYGMTQQQKNMSQSGEEGNLKIVKNLILKFFWYRYVLVGSEEKN